jgi:hypothetical protein
VAIRNPTKIVEISTTILVFILFIHPPHHLDLIFSITSLRIIAKLSNILPPKTITAAIYIGIPNLSPKYAKAAAIIAFPKNPDINMFVELFDKLAHSSKPNLNTSIATDI